MILGLARGDGLLLMRGWNQWPSGQRLARFSIGNTPGGAHTKPHGFGFRCCAARDIQPDFKARLSANLTMLQANILTAMLGGCWGRASDGPPGARILSEGL